MIKWTSAEDDLAAKTKAKADKKKTKKLKKEVRSLTQDSVITKLREELELSQLRAEHFEREFFNLKKSHEVLNDCYRTITDADQQLQSEMFVMSKELKAKDAEIEAMKWNNANENDDLGMQIKNLLQLVEKQVETISEYEELTERSIDKIDELTETIEKLRLETAIDLSCIDTEEVNDQINQILKKE